MIAKVQLTYSVTMYVEGSSKEEIQDWLESTSPSEAKKLSKNMVEEDYSEEILGIADGYPDYTISGK